METSEKTRPALTFAVLAVSADEALSRALAASLAWHGIAVRCANSEAEGLQLLPDGNFDLLVYDVNGPAPASLLEAIQNTLSRSPVALMALAEQIETLETFQNIEWAS